MLHGVGWRTLGKDLLREIKDDNVSSGAAALAFYLMLAVFPAAIFLLTVLPYLPIPRLEMALMDFLRQALPSSAAQMFTRTVRTVTSRRSGGLLSFGFLFMIWSASSGIYAVMQQLNIMYGVKERRSLWRARGLALILTLIFFVGVVGAFGLVVFGGVLQSWIGDALGWSHALLLFFATFRWAVIGLASMLAFALIYYLGPDVDRPFRLVSPGSVFGVVGVLLTSLGFKLYVASFARFDATYGSIGAVIALMMWLFLTGWVVLLGAEIDALIDGYAGRIARRGACAETPERAIADAVESSTAHSCDSDVDEREPAARR